MNLTKMKTSPALENGGVWVELDSKTSIKVRRLGCKAFRDSLKEKSEKYKVALRLQNLDDDVAERIYAEALAETILIDWRGMELGDSVIEYSAEQAYEILSDEENKDFKELVVELAREAETFREQATAAIEKN